MTVVAVFRRETNAGIRQTEPLETDGFTVKSLFKNAKISIFHNDINGFLKENRADWCFTISKISAYSK